MKIPAVAVLVLCVIAMAGGALLALTDQEAQVLNDDKLWNSIEKWELERGDCSIVFHDKINGKWVGTLSWCEGAVKFNGSFDESAKKFFELVWKLFVYPDWDEYKNCKER